MRLIVAITALSIAAPAYANARAIGMLRDWVAAVNGHAAGESDAALSSITAWTYDDLELMRAYLEALVDAPTRSNRERGKRRSSLGGDDIDAIRDLEKIAQAGSGLDVFRRRAALLHTDAAIFGGPVVVSALPDRRHAIARARPERSVIVKSFDGRVENFELENPHWTLARDMLDALPGRPRDPLLSQWYRAIGSYFAYERRWADALKHFEQARHAVPDDAQVLFGEACLQETLGSPRVQNFVRVTTLPNGLVIRGVFPPQTHWRSAENLLRRALAIDPQFVEARLRLGRVLFQQKKYDEALPFLVQAAGDSTDRTLRYYAHLFSGDALASLGRVEDARESYERAIAQWPTGQAARLGLAAAMRAAGDREQGLAVVVASLEEPPADEDDEPWWEYPFGDAAHMQTLMDALRAPFAKPAP